MTSFDRTSAAPTVDRLAIIRRIYFYLMAFVSLVTGLLATRGLLDVLLTAWLSASADVTVNDASFIRNAIARDGSLLLVAAPIFLLHWAYIRNLARPEGPVAERVSALRKLFLYGSMGFVLTLAATSLYDLLGDAARGLLSVPPETYAPDLGTSTWLTNLLVMGIGLAFLLYFGRQLRLDGDLGTEIRWAGTLRRLFQTIVGLMGLGLLIFGTSRVLEVALRVALEAIAQPALDSVGPFWWQRMLADGVASLLVGGLLWRVNWLRWETFVENHEPEARTALRRTYLYAATVLSAAAALVPAAGLLNDLLLRLFGVATSSELPDLAGPLSLLPLGIVAWRWHWLQVRTEAERYGDTPESATVRRLYYYLVAAVGLVLLWFGLVEILRALFDWLLIGADDVSIGFRAEQLANGLSLLAVGAPVWALHWRTVQIVASGDERTARAERSSGPRRAYLYGVALVGALLILFDLASVLYRVLLWLLGEPNADPVSTATLDSLVRSGTAAVFWIVHVLAIRRDTQYDDEIEAAPTDIAARRAALTARIEQLEAELATARQELADLP